MAGSFVPAVSSLISVAATSGELTVGSTVGMYESMIGWISNGTVSQKVKITSILDSTHLFAQKVIDAEGSESGSSVHGNYLDNRLKPPNYGNSDLSAYTGGTYTLYCDDQFIYATNLSQTF